MKVFFVILNLKKLVTPFFLILKEFVAQINFEINQTQSPQFT